MNLYPKAYFKKVTDITVEFLNENNIKGLMLDIDNTCTYVVLFGNKFFTLWIWRFL